VTADDFSALAACVTAAQLVGRALAWLVRAFRRQVKGRRPVRQPQQPQRDQVLVCVAVGCALTLVAATLLYQSRSSR
jgi:hypothetical protein